MAPPPPQQQQQQPPAGPPRPNVNTNIPGAQRVDPLRSSLRGQKPSLQPGAASSAHARAPKMAQLPPQESEDDKAGSLIQTLSSELNDFSQTAQSTFMEMFGQCDL